MSKPKTSKDLREAIMARAKRDTEEEFEEEFELDDFEDEDDDPDIEEIDELANDMAEFEEEEFELDDEEQNVAELISLIHEDGVVAFMEGLGLDQNPYAEENTYDEDFAPVWAGGWMEAYTHALVTDLVLSVSGLLESKTAEEGSAALKRLEASFANVTDVLPLEECQEFWDTLEEAE
jgi:hypothetical protein